LPSHQIIVQYIYYKKISDKVDCERRVSQNAPSHFHVINLIEHALEGNDALMFRMHMKLLRETCALLPTTDLQRLAYLEEPHKKLKIMLCETLCG